MCGMPLRQFPPLFFFEGVDHMLDYVCVVSMWRVHTCVYEVAELPFVFVISCHMCVVENIYV